MMLRGHSPATPHWRAHIHRGFVGYASMAALFYALTRLSLPTAVTLNYTSSLFFSALCIVKLKDRPRPRVWLALSLGFFGVVLLLRPTFTPQQWLPGLIGLVSGISAGFAVFQVRELGRWASSPGGLYSGFFACPARSVWSGCCWGRAFPPSRRPMSGRCWRGRVRHAGAVGDDARLQGGRRYLVASFAYLTVVFSALLGVALWDDVLSVASLLAMGLIVSAGMLAARA
ncbi:Predicted permease, DMT superfamily [Chromobacterium violaceum]|uniref:Predicted permease, DMT superfamily n=1 Tax=Chromobacterium violaceum TaxID=536 RepID=A0A3S4I5N5_CHRVL|nr:Predicted permease, DMT superfamily [Chromobacterium violaceum]